MNIVGTILLLSGTFLPFVAYSGSIENARPSMKTCVAFTGAAGAAMYGLFHFPERIRVAESQSQLEPAITRYHANEAAIGEIKVAAKPSWERRSNQKELSPSLAGAENRFLGLTFALRAVPTSFLVNTARTQIWHPLVHEYAYE